MQRYLITSIPKSVTHLLGSVLGHLTGLPVISLKTKFNGDSPREFIEPQLLETPAVYVGHFRREQFDECFNDGTFNIITLIRDPRGIVLSMRDYLVKGESTLAQHIGPSLKNMPEAEQLKRIASGIRLADGMSVAPIDLHCQGFRDWEQDGVPTVRYEDFFTLTTKTSRKRLLGALGSLGFNADDSESAIQNSLKTKTKTRNKAVRSRWKTDMPTEVQSFIRRQFPVVFQELGYSSGRLDYVRTVLTETARQFYKPRRAA